MKIYNGMSNTSYSNNINRNIFQNNKLKNNKSTPTFGYYYQQNYHPAGCAVSGISALFLLGSTLITPAIVFNTLQDNDKEQTELNIAKGDSLISDYKNRLEKEKEILTLKTYPTDKLMQTLKNIGDGKDGITYQDGETYECSDKTPIFIDKMRNFEQKIYKNLPPEKRELLNSIKTNIQINGKENTDDLNVSQNFSNSVNAGSLAVVDSLLLLTQLGETIENESTQKLYNKLVFDIANRYTNQSFDDYSLNEKLQNIRDNIANNMTAEEQQAYEDEYNKKLEEFKQQTEKQIKELNKEYDSVFAAMMRLALSICAAGTVLALGVPVWLMITDAFDYGS